MAPQSLEKRDGAVVESHQAHSLETSPSQESVLTATDGYEEVEEGNPRCSDTGKVQGGVSVERAEAEFAELQREFTGLSRASQRTNRINNAEKRHAGVLPVGKGGFAVEQGGRRGRGEDDDDDDDASVFDLEAALRGDLDATHGAGIKNKHLGAYWDGLTVRGVCDSANHVKTLLHALLDFVDIVRPAMKLLGMGRKPAEATLLRDCQGVCKPGEMLLVLGKPGSGCTTFLKTMANQRYGYTSIEGEVSYGPWTAGEFGRRYRGEAVYNAEDDMHHPTLTVEQTLGFALDVKMPARRPGHMSKAEFKEHVITTLLRMFNIEHTRRTVVGDHLVRGISGGERKRVSIAEMMITNACILSWDNSTRGLDASTALDFVRSLRVQTDLYKTTTFVSLYQASENIYRLFDKVLVLDEGRQVFFGPAADARAYFQGLGFAARPRQTTPDYLTGCTDEWEREYAAGRSERDSPHSPDTLAAAFLASGFRRRLDEEMASYRAGLPEQAREHDDFLEAVRQGKRGIGNRSVYQVSFPIQVWALMRRQFILKLQDRFNLSLSWIRSVVIALVLGSLYWNLDDTSGSAFSKGGLMFISLLFNAFQAFSELAGLLQGRAIVDKHKAFAFHRPSALWIGQIFVDQVFSASEIMVFSLIVYFMTNLARDAGAFFTFYLMILSGNIAMTLFFRTIGCLSPDFDYAIKFAVVLITFFVTTAGYLIQYESEKVWLRWIYWVNVLGLSFSSMMQNEFMRINMTCTSDSLIPSGPGYDDIDYQVCTLPGSTAGSTLVSGPAYIAESFSYYPGDLWRNWAIVVGLFVFFLAMNVVLGEFVRYTSGGSSPKVFVRENDERRALNERLREGRAARRRDGGADERGPELRVESESVLTWEALCYDVPVAGGTRRLLDDVYGFVRPGELTALMGASGAGKSTLLDVLAARKNIGIISGSVLVDGERPGRQFQRSTSYAEQLDVHEPTQTVREALRFSAELRQPRDTPQGERHAYVEEIIALLEMDAFADAVIGTPEAGLTVEQRKRVTIGVELAAKPELLLFLDEPTSGLDSQSAFHIVRFLKKLAAAGQAILCTIHQPNQALFESFDRLLLLQKGGRTVYFGDIGPDACVLRSYLARHGAEPLPTDNVAEFMLEAIGAGSRRRVGGRDWSDIWAESPEMARVKSTVAQIKEERRAMVAQGLVSSPPLEDQGLQGQQGQQGIDDLEYASPASRQLRVVIARMSRSFWRSPNYLFTRLFNHVAVALLTGLTYLRLDDSRASLQYRVFVMFQITVLPALIITQVEFMFQVKRALFFREASSKMYSTTAFAAAITLAEMPYSILCAVAFFLPLYFMPGFQLIPSRAGYQFLMVLITEVFAVSLGQGIASLTPSPRIAAQFNPFIIIIFALFCGVTIPVSRMPAFFRSWLYQLNPFSRLISGTVVTALHGLKVRCTPAEFNAFTAPPGQACGAYMQPFFDRGGPGYLANNDTSHCEYCAYKIGDEFYQPLGLAFDQRWRDLGIYIAYIGSNLVVLFLASRYLNFNKR